MIKHGQIIDTNATSTYWSQFALGKFMLSIDKSNHKGQTMYMVMVIIQTQVVCGWYRELTKTLHLVLSGEFSSMLWEYFEQKGVL